MCLFIYTFNKHAADCIHQRKYILQYMCLLCVYIHTYNAIFKKTTSANGFYIVGMHGPRIRYRGDAVAMGCRVTEGVTEGGCTRNRRG